MTELFVNPARLVRPTEPTGAEPLEFHRRLPGYAPTPLIEASELAAGLGIGRMRIKDESSRLGLPSFKILGASWATYQLLIGRIGQEPVWTNIDELRDAVAPLGSLTLVAATDGNHGRAVARVARWLGYGARIFVPEGTAQARIDGIASEGADVDVVDGTYDNAVAASAALADERVVVVSDTAWDGYVDVPGWVIDGYSTIFAEVDQQLDRAPFDTVVVQMGVGALAAAVVDHFAATARIIAVEPVDAACGLHSARAGHAVAVPGPHRSIMAGLNCGNVSPVAWPRVVAGVDLFVAVDDSAAERAMRDLASAGVTAGETGAAGWAGLRAAVEAGNDVGESVLVLCTEGATDPEAYARIVGSSS
jgi:diaminopropionate ammonia-lyase